MNVSHYHIGAYCNIYMHVRWSMYNWNMPGMHILVLAHLGVYTPVIVYMACNTLLTVYTCELFPPSSPDLPNITRNACPPTVVARRIKRSCHVSKSAPECDGPGGRLAADGSASILAALCACGLCEALWSDAMKLRRLQRLQPPRRMEAERRDRVRIGQ